MPDIGSLPQCITKQNSDSSASSTTGDRIVFRSKDFDEAIASGKQYLIYDNKVYDVGEWTNRHPGGAAVIRSYIGRDASNSIDLFHGNVNRIRLYMRKFYIGDFVADSPADKELLRMTRDFNRFHKQIIEEGFYKTNVWNFAREVAAMLISIGLTFYLLKFYANDFWGVCAASFSLFMFWHRVGFFMHDSLHYSVSQHSMGDKIISMIGTTYLHGNSYSWWVDQHRIHHANPNDLEEDVLVQLLPFIVVSTRLFRPTYSKFYQYMMTFDAVSKFLVSLQHITLLPGLAISRFLLYREGLCYIIYLFRTGRFFNNIAVWIELLGMVFYWSWFIGLTLMIPSISYRVLFVLMPHVFIALLHLQLNLSHSVHHLDRTGSWPLKEHFIQLQFRNTLDIDNDPWCDFFHGGLQFHVAHHLFPRVPRHNLRRLTERVKEFAAEQNLKYVALSFYGNVANMLANLRDIAEMAQTKTLKELLECEDFSSLKTD